MHDPAVTDALPTPEQMRNFIAAEKAAWLARRLREASRALVTGNVAFFACLMGTLLVVAHSDWFKGATPFVLCGIMWGYLLGLMLSWRWMKRQRSGSSVVVLDQREVEAKRAPAHPFRSAVVLSGTLLFSSLTIALWGVAFRHMSNAAMTAALGLFPAFTIGFFVYRFVLFQFWEDMLFVASVVIAYAPFLLHAWNLAPLSIASLPLVIVGIVSLHLRWVRWTRSLPAEDGDGGVKEVRS